MVAIVFPLSLSCFPCLLTSKTLAYQIPNRGELMLDRPDPNLQNTLDRAETIPDPRQTFCRSTSGLATRCCRLVHDQPEGLTVVQHDCLVEEWHISCRRCPSRCSSFPRRRSTSKVRRPINTLRLATFGCHVLLFPAAGLSHFSRHYRARLLRFLKAFAGLEPATSRLKFVCSTN